MSPSPAIGRTDAPTPSIATVHVVDALKRVLGHYADPTTAAALAGRGRLVPQLTDALTHEVVQVLTADPWSRVEANAGHRDHLRATLRRLIADLLPAMMAAWSTPAHRCGRLSALVDVYLDAGGRAEIEAALGACSGRDGR